MPIHSITLSEQNDTWLSNQIDDSRYGNKSELINDLIRQARRTEAINNKLTIAETISKNKGFIEQNSAQMLAEFNADRRDIK